MSHSLRLHLQELLDCPFLGEIKPPNQKASIKLPKMKVITLLFLNNHIITKNVLNIFCWIFARYNSILCYYIIMYWIPKKLVLNKSHASMISSIVKFLPKLSLRVLWKVECMKKNVQLFVFKLRFHLWGASTLSYHKKVLTDDIFIK